MGRLRVYRKLEQGTPEWFAARCGILTASVVGQLITPKTVRPAANDYSRSLTAQLVAERITGYVEPTYPSRSMERGTLDEPYAREKYAQHYAPVALAGFMVREFRGMRIGYSPDGLVGRDGLIEIKSRAQKAHLQTVLMGEVPDENMAQLQCGLLVSGRRWIDYVSYCGGMRLWVKRVRPIPAWREAILDAAAAFEANAIEMTLAYGAATRDLPDTERIDHFPEMEML